MAPGSQQACRRGRIYRIYRKLPIGWIYLKLTDLPDTHRIRQILPSGKICRIGQILPIGAFLTQCSYRECRDCRSIHVKWALHIECKLVARYIVRQAKHYYLWIWAQNVRTPFAPTPSMFPRRRIDRASTNIVAPVRRQEPLQRLRLLKEVLRAALTHSERRKRTGLGGPLGKLWVRWPWIVPMEMQHPGQTELQLTLILSPGPTQSMFTVTAYGNAARSSCLLKR